MEDIIRFLEQLRRHNNREWFEANKLWYRDVKARFDGLVARLIDAIAAFDPSVAGLAVKDCTYRIYRDTRFSPNKEPYKTHFGAYFLSSREKVGVCRLLFPCGAAGRRADRRSPAFGRIVYAGTERVEKRPGRDLR